MRKKSPDKKMNKVLIIGNGISRLKLKEFIQNWPFQIWVCNRGYTIEKLPTIDYVCTVHKEIIEETNLKTLSPFENSDEQFVRKEGWSTGNLAIMEALERGFDEVHLVGFDFGGKDVYQNYEVDGSTFKNQYSKILELYPEAENKIYIHYPEDTHVKFITLIDDNFVEGFKGFFTSLLKANPHFDYEFILLDNGLTSQNFQVLREIYPHISLKKIRKRFYQFPENSTIDKLISTYYKLEIFDPLNFDPSIKRLIFMDMDMLVQGSLDYLVNVDLEGKALGACRQYVIGKDTLNDKINSGLLIVDFDKLSADVFSTMLKQVKKRYYLPDQDIINENFIRTEDCFYLPKEYNVEKRMVNSKKLQDVYDKAVCIHYVGTKPWEEQSKKETDLKKVYEKWWSLFKKETTENILEEIPLKFRTKNTAIISDERELIEVYDCLFIKEEEKLSESFLRRTIKENLSDKGYLCGYGGSLSLRYPEGKILKILKKKPELNHKGFWLFFKNKEKKKTEGYQQKISEEEFNKMVKGKSVIFVAPSSCMKGRGLGSFIDSFDIVIRTNNMLNAMLQDDIKKDFGSKVDILYVNVTYERDMYEEWNQETWKQLGLQVICRCMKKTPPINSFYFKWRSIKTISELPPPTLFLGTMAIYDLLKFDLKSLYITGMDGYKEISDIIYEVDESEYITGYMPKYEKKRRQQNIGELISKHDRFRDTRYILDLEKNESKLTIDPFCKERMENVVNGKN